MLALFALGVMSLVWMAAVAAVILVEKVLPRGEAFARAAAVGLVAAGLWVAVAPDSVPGLTRAGRRGDDADADGGEPVSWRISGSYFESCSCDAICPCRRIDGVPGGRSTHGVCTGVLTWLIERGDVDGVDLTGLPVAMAVRYDDDEPGSPWTWILYLDEGASEEQRAGLEGIYSGRLGGDAATHFPWAWKASTLVGVRTVPIEVDHSQRRQWLRIRDRVSVRIRDAWAGDEIVTCVIPGHERAGEELVADELVLEDGPFAVSYRGTCGYGSSFDYAG